MTPDVPARQVSPVVFVALAVLAMGLLLAGIRAAVGLTPDSVAYVAAARSLANGHGLTLPGGGPMIHFPPLYPALLAAAGLVAGVDPLVAATWLNVALFGANVLLIGGVLARTLRSPGLAVFGTFAALTTLPMLRVHSMAWSEPLCCGCCATCRRKARPSTGHPGPRGR